MTGGQAGLIDDRPAVDAFGVLRHQGSWVSLSRTHEAIMRGLIGQLGQAVSRPYLAACAWPEGGHDLHAIDVHIYRLRPRVARIGLVIHTLRGRGYMLEAVTGESATRRR